MDAYEPELDLSRLPQIITARCAQLGIDVSSCEPGSTRLLAAGGGWFEILMGYSTLHSLGQVHVTALSGDTNLN